jgi:hypothetical protein
VLAAGTLAEVEANPDERVQAFFQRRLLPGARHASLVEALEWPG